MNPRPFSCRETALPTELRTSCRLSSQTSFLLCSQLSANICWKRSNYRHYYKDKILVSTLLPALQKIYKNDYYVFQQDGAPAQQILCKNGLKRIWPIFFTKMNDPSSPDLNPMDYFVWSNMISQLKKYKINNLEQFKKIILKIWDENIYCNLFKYISSFLKIGKNVCMNTFGSPCKYNITQKILYCKHSYQIDCLLQLICYFLWIFYWIFNWISL